MSGARRAAPRVGRRLGYALVVLLGVLGAAEGVARLVAGPPEHRTLFQRWGDGAGEATFLQLFAGALGPEELTHRPPRDRSLSWFVAEGGGGGAPGPAGARRYTRREGKLMWRENDVHAVDVPAPPGVRRVFALGGSTTYGIPGAVNDAFSDRLWKDLDARASRRWQVVNVANPGLDSYDIRQIVDETAAMDPAAYVLYEGHNDCGNAFQQARYLSPQGARALRADVLLGNSLRLYGLLKDVFAPVRQTALGSAGSTAIPDSPESVAERARAAETQRALVVDGWRENVRAILATARRAGAGVVVVLPVSNLYEAPVASAHYAFLDGEARARFDATLAAARKGAATLDELRAAAASDDRYAELAWRLGKAELAAGNAAEGRRWLVQAKEWDVVSARAWEAVVVALREEAEAAGVPVVDAGALLAGEDGLPARDWFVDNLHLNAAAHHVLGDALVEPVEAVAKAPR